MEEAQDVALRRLGDGEDAIGLPRGGPHRATRVDVAQAIGQVLRKHQVDAVVNGDHRVAPGRRRQHVMRLVHEIHALARQPPRNPELLADRVRLRVLRDMAEVGGQRVASPRGRVSVPAPHTRWWCRACAVPPGCCGYRCRCRSRAACARRWRHGGVRAFRHGRPSRSRADTGAAGPPSGAGVSRRTPRGSAGGAARSRDSVAADRPRRCSTSASGTNSTLRPRARTEVQRSTSSVYMKNRSSSPPTASRSVPPDQQACAADPGPLAGFPAAALHVAHDSPEPPLIEREQRLLLQFAPRADWRAERQLRGCCVRPSVEGLRSRRPDDRPGRPRASSARRVAPWCPDSAAARTRRWSRRCPGCWRARSRGCRRRRSSARRASARGRRPVSRRSTRCRRPSPCVG